MEKLKGIIFIALGAISYGILATIVKYANNLGIHTSILTLGQYLFGVILLSIYPIFIAKKQKQEKTTLNAKAKLLIFGSTLGLTSVFYYLSLKYIPVSIAIILLMQTIWMSILLEYFITKKTISKLKILGTVIILFGTVLATNLIQTNSTTLNFSGLALGLCAALCYTLSMYSSSNIEPMLPNYIRSKYLVLGGFIVVLLFWNKDIITHFNGMGLLKWGLVLAFFGTFLPPLLFTKGFPIVGIGLGSILAALEIPVSILSANIILKEQVIFIQWIGVAIIILSVIMINYQQKETK